MLRTVFSVRCAEARAGSRPACLDTAVLLHERQRLLRADALDAVVEVGADEQREIDERLARDATAFQQASRSIVSGTIGRKVPCARQEFLSRDRKEPHQPRRAEEQRIVVLARGGPDDPRAPPCARPAPRLRTAPGPSAGPSGGATRALPPPSPASGARSWSPSNRRRRCRHARGGRVSALVTLPDRARASQSPAP